MVNMDPISGWRYAENGDQADIGFHTKHITDDSSKTVTRHYVSISDRDTTFTSAMRADPTNEGIECYVAGLGRCVLDNLGQWRVLPLVTMPSNGQNLIGAAYDGHSRMIHLANQVIGTTWSGSDLVIPWPGSTFGNGIWACTITSADSGCKALSLNFTASSLANAHVNCWKIVSGAMVAMGSSDGGVRLQFRCVGLVMMVRWRAWWTMWRVVAFLLILYSISRISLGVTYSFIPKAQLPPALQDWTIFPIQFWGALWVIAGLLGIWAAVRLFRGIRA